MRIRVGMGRRTSWNCVWMRKEEEEEGVDPLPTVVGAM